MKMVEVASTAPATFGPLVWPDCRPPQCGGTHNVRRIRNLTVTGQSAPLENNPPRAFRAGFPTGSGGDLYGGAVYTSSAQSADTGLQAAAAADASARWGSGAVGREVIGHSVCKGKFRPWKAGERQYGCFRHTAARKARMHQAGLRAGWEPFDQWPDPTADKPAANEITNTAGDVEDASGMEASGMEARGMINPRPAAAGSFPEDPTKAKRQRVD